MRFVAALLMLTLSTACAGSPERTPEAVTGPITAIEVDGEEIESITITTEAGDDLEVRVDNDIDYGFDLSHLHEHQDSGDPVEVRLDERDGVVYAISIEDA